MSRTCALFVSLVLLSLASPATAGIFGRGKPKSDPAARVPELLIQLKTDKDEAKRVAAAEELRQYDPKAFPEILATLIEVLAKDASPGVRSEAARSTPGLRWLLLPHLVQVGLREPRRDEPETERSHDESVAGRRCDDAPHGGASVIIS